MQVKDGSWYQCENKEIVRAAQSSSAGVFDLFDQSGQEVGCVLHDGTGNGRNRKPCTYDLIREVSDPTKPLKLRVGGKYLDGYGIEREFNAHDPDDDAFPFVSNDLTFAIHGRCCNAASKHDLICEILDPAPEPELVFVPGQPYECRNGEKRIFIGSNPLGDKGRCLVFSCGHGNLSTRHKDGRCLQDSDNIFDIIRPWIDPPTEFVFNGKRYQVGPEIK